MLREIDDLGFYTNTTTDKLIFEEKNKFKNWFCSAGAKGLYIDHDGNIWRSVCFSAEIDRFNKNGWSNFLTKNLKNSLNKSSFSDSTYTKWKSEKKKKFRSLAQKYRQQNEAFEKIIWSNDKHQYPGVIGNIYEGFFYSHSEIFELFECTFDTCGCGSDIWYPKIKKPEDIKNVYNLNEYVEKNKRTDYDTLVKGKEKAAINNFHALEPSYPIDYQVLWDLGRYCNFNCNYCWPSVHNKTASHLDYKTMIRVVDAILYYIIDIHKNKKVRFFFGGGEPTWNPDFFDVCDYLARRNQIISISTNGSNTIEYYTKLATVVNNFLFSIHFGSIEESKIVNEKHVLENIKKVHFIQKHHHLKDKWLELKIMAPPGYVKTAINFYNKIVDIIDLDQQGRDGRQMGAITIVPIREIGNSSEKAEYNLNEQMQLTEFYANTI